MIDSSGGTFSHEDGTEFRWKTHNRCLQVSYLSGSCFLYLTSQAAAC
jgi:hypothetical protein